MKVLALALLLLVPAPAFAHCIALLPLKQMTVTPGTPLTLVPADLNGDGADELIAITGFTIKILWNDGATNYTEEPLAPTATRGYAPSIATGETDGTPGDELAIADSLGARLLTKRRDGSWSRTDYAVTGTAMTIGIADVTGDARGEVLVIAEDGGTAHLNVFEAQTAQLLISLDVSPNFYFYFVNMDVDHDGRKDLILVGSGTRSPIHHFYYPREDGFISIFLRTNDSLGPEQRIVQGHAFLRPVVGDFDGDGFQDILIGRYFKGFLLFRGRRDGGFATAVDYGAGDQSWGITYYTSADVDGDSIDDLVRIESDGRGIGQLLLGSPAGFIPAAEFRVPYPWAPPVFAHTTRNTRAVIVPRYDGSMAILAPAPCRSKRRVVTH